MPSLIQKEVRSMKIKATDRVEYAHNPLVEVICQLRFDRLLLLDAQAPTQFQEDFARERYPLLTVEQPSSIQIALGNSPLLKANDLQIPSPSIPAVYHFTSEDSDKKISLTSEFISFSCKSYTGWEEFRLHFHEALAAFVKCYPNLIFRRVGLRYKDLIEREALGLANNSWDDLLSPLVSGIFSHSAYFNGDFIDESSVSQQVTQTVLELDDCSLLLQCALLKSTAPDKKQAFLIDADFFHESPRFLTWLDDVPTSLETLHANAGAIFRHCIKEKLHDALGPKRK